MERNFKIFSAKKEDAAELLQIYKPYVLETAISFEWELPSEEEFLRRIEAILETYPYLVAKDEKGILGYAYAGAFKGREAYKYSVETTIYLRKNYTGRGLGTTLYQKLEEILKAQGVLNLAACIAHTERIDDRYLSNISEGFHRHMGFRTVGCFQSSGYKFDQWYDILWMEKAIGEHSIPAPIFRTFEEVRDEFCL